VFTADASGTVTFRPTLPAAACDAVLVAVDLTSCDTSEGVFVSPRDVPVDFTRSSSTIYKTGSLGTVASGLYQWTTGDYVEDTFTGTGLTSIRGLAFTLPIIDASSQYCGPVDRWQWSVAVNGTDVGDQIPYIIGNEGASASASTGCATSSRRSWCRRCCFTCPRASARSRPRRCSTPS
jgi:hypothetical protein